MKLTDKVAVVTGAAMGLGREIAAQFAKEGARLILADINDELGRAAESSIVTEGGVAKFIHTDVGKTADVQRMVSETISSFGHLDILVNNAGIAEVAPIEEMSEEVWDRIITVNLKGVWLGSKYAAPKMRSQGSGVIVNMSSELGLVGFPAYSAYCASKGGIIALTRALAVELAPHIRVNCICPGIIETPMFERELREYLSKGKDPDKARSDMAKRYPLSRLGRLSDVAKAALYLASDDSAWVTGIALPVDGGGIAA